MANATNIWCHVREKSNNQAPPINDNPQTTKENKPTQEHLISPPLGAHHHQCSCIIFQFHLISNFSLATNVTSCTPWPIKVSYEKFLFRLAILMSSSTLSHKTIQYMIHSSHMWYLTLEVYIILGWNALSFHSIQILHKVIPLKWRHISLWLEKVLLIPLSKITCLHSKSNSF